MTDWDIRPWNEDDLDIEPNAKPIDQGRRPLIDTTQLRHFEPKPLPEVTTPSRPAEEGGSTLSEYGWVFLIGIAIANPLIGIGVLALYVLNAAFAPLRRKSDRG